jgi:tetratricopeptide (TPR) repeat protein
MEDSSAVLIQIQNIMPFNPFKTNPTHKKSSHHHHHQNESSDNDSWHDSQPHSAPSSGPLSWFSSGWSASTTVASTNNNTMKINDATNNTLVSPARSMIMLRATHSNEEFDNTHLTQNNGSTNTNVSHGGSNYLPPYPQPTSQRHSMTPIQSEDAKTENEKKLVVDFPTQKANNTLLEDFPSKQTYNKSEVAEVADNNAATARRIASSYNKTVGELDEAYPGFAMYQTARFQYCLGKYSEALDTTTECLAFQKVALASSSPNRTSPTLGPQTVPAAHAANTNNDNMTALDLRSTFVAGVGNSVRNLMTSTTAQQKQTSSPHPMLSNSMATMIAQYPMHPCIAQTLLLRGRVLADCGLYGLRDGNGDDDDAVGDTDFSLLLQAIRNVEISVAILRKLDQEYDIATSLTFLGTLRTLLGHYDEADRAYEEALSTFRGLRLAAKYDQKHAIDEKMATICVQSIQKITSGIANVLYLRGKLYHCQKMHQEAFECYHKAFILSRKYNRANRQNECVKKIARCMKSRSALEKLVSAHIDDQAGV